MQRLLTRKEVKYIVGISYAEIDRRVKAGKFPSPIKDGEHHNSRVFWVSDEIEEYVAELVQKSRAVP